MNLSRARVTPILLLAAGAVLVTTTGCAAWRINQSVELARNSEPLQQRPENPTLRLLIVGDSTAVGTGASSGYESVAGSIAREYPRLLIENRARDGAKFADVVAQLGGDQHFDILLVQAGGNDVIRMRKLEALRIDIETVADRADKVILMPAGNVGNAPFFFAPVSWLMTQRSRALHRFVRRAAARTNAGYVNLFHERADDPFVKNPGLNASDGLHPSDAGYQAWYRELESQAGLAKRLSSAIGAGSATPAVASLPRALF